MLDDTYIEISKSNLEHNVKTLINKYNNYEYYFGVVKGNVYGHGYDCIKTMIESGINYLAVSNILEAREVRRLYKDIPVLCLEPINIDHLSMCEALNITITVDSFKYAEELVKLGRNVKVHLKVNSGMNRLGIEDKKEFKKTYDLLVNNSIKVEGVFAHFATSGVNDKYWDTQLDNFKKVTSLVPLSKFKIVHLGRSLTILNHKKIDICNGVRLGIIMYGYNLSPKKRSGLKGNIRNFINNYNKMKYHISDTTIEFNEVYKQVISLYSKVRSIRYIKPNQGVGYGNVSKSKKERYIAILPIGYKDGFSIKNVNGRCYINNKYYKILQVNMCMTIVEIDKNIKENDTVELIGKNVTALEVSRRCNIIVYELICTLKENINRIIGE